MEIVHNFHSGYFDCRGSFQTVVDSYCCITGRTQLATKRNSYFHFQTIIDIQCWMRNALGLVTIRGLTSHNNYIQKVNKYTKKNRNFQIRVGTMVDQKTVLKQAGVVHDIRS